MNHTANGKKNNELLYKLSGVGRDYVQGEVLVKALSEIDLEIKKGEFTAFVGPSGSGKTTLLNLLGALDRPTAGEVVFEGRSIGNLGETELSKLRLRRMGFVFQAYNLLPVFTALENVEYLLILQNAPEKGRKDRCMEILKIMGLEELANRYPSEMSGGQQQRVAVARAMVSSPSVVLADEPTANLDSVTASNLLDYMIQMNHTFGTTFLFSTHDSHVMEKASRVVELHDGRY